MNTDPTVDANRHMAETMGYAERMAKAEAELEVEFVKACLTKDALDLAGFHSVSDWSAGFHQKRPAYVCEVMMEAMEGNHLVTAFVMQSLMLCARKGDADAQAAIRKMARNFAHHNAYVEE